MRRHYHIPRALRACAPVLVILTAALARPAGAQEMEPRAYSSSPIGMNFIAASAGNTRGDVLFDASIPVTDVIADLNLMTLGYARTFRFAGKQGLVAGGVAYARGDIEGLVSSQTRHTGRSGLTDMRVKASLNLLGPGAMTREEFAVAPRRTIVGVSLTVQPPTGQYDTSRLINLGTNRWAFKPEVGVSVPVGRWFLDAYAGAWFYTANDEFYPGESTRRQDPLIALQGHASYTFRSRAWMAFDATWYGGGEGTVDGGPPSERQSTTRIGGTGSIPLTQHQSIKIAASTGASARTGTDFNTYLLGWQVAWFNRKGATQP
jgi:outer membrane putative beta-barrel porin/alpha-amylase